MCEREGRGCSSALCLRPCKLYQASYAPNPCSLGLIVEPAYQHRQPILLFLHPQMTATAIHAGRSMEDVSGIALMVSRADNRAEHVSVMARQLLSVLRDFPRREDPAGRPPRAVDLQAGACACGVCTLLLCSSILLLVLHP